LLKVGLTGAIGTGKSTVGKLLSALGAHFIQADSIARDLMQPGQKVYEEVVRAFGSEILSPDGTINRQELADAAFGTPSHPAQRAQELNGIVHPAVGRAQEAWMAEAGKADSNAIAVVEAALIFEAGLEAQFDKIVVVTCPFETRVQRWMSRTNVDGPTARQELKRRMTAQFPEEQKIAAADYLIDNSQESCDTASQVLSVFERLKQDGAEKSVGPS
jgi:dephospho-CoA kinase